MASTIPPVLVELQLETANIKAQMEQLNKNFSNFGDTVSKQTSFLSNFKSAAVGVFAGNVMTQGLNLLKSGIQGAIQDAQTYEKMTNQLRAGIESTGNAAGLSVEGLKAHASQLESLAAVDENLILQSEAVFQTFTNIRNVAGEGNDIFNQASAAALDLSVKMGGDLQGATVQLGKALNDPIKGITALTRVGVVFTDAQKAQIKALVQSGDVMGAQKIILGEMKTEFGGAAAAAGDTFAGAVFRAKDKVADFARDLVTNLQPILLKIGKIIGEIYNDTLKPLFSWISKNKEAVFAFVAVIGTALAIFKTYKLIMGGVTIATELYTLAVALKAGATMADVVATEAQTGAMTLLNAVMKANPIALVVAALAALAAAFVWAWNHSETFRKVVVTVAKGVIYAVKLIVDAVITIGKAVFDFAVWPFKQLLKLIAFIPGPLQGVAKGAIKFLDGVDKSFDGAKKSSDSFFDGMIEKVDSVKDKKITLFGGDKAKDGKTPAGKAPVGGLSADEIAAAQKSAKEKAKALAKLNTDVKTTYDKMNTVISDARDKSVQLETDFNKKVLSINKDYNEKAVALQKENTNKQLELLSQADQDRASVVQKSADLLRSAFEAGAKFDLAKMFDDSDKSGAGLLQKMKDKLTAVKKLQQQAGALASAGFSQTFIQEVISQGPEIGGSMADAVLNSAPETQSQLKDLYAGLQNVSQHGLDALANQMSTSTSLATEDLVKEYARIGTDLDVALKKNSQELADALTKNQTELQDALLAAQIAYNDSIDALEKDTKDKLKTLQVELQKTAETIKQLAGAKASVNALANSPASPIYAGVTSLGLASKSTGDLIITNNNTVNGMNLTDPNATVDAMANASRFGSSQSLSSGRIAMLERMGIM